MYRILDILKGETGYISGEEIGRKLDISRAAVWKGISRLRQEGYEIEAVTNKGYRLAPYETMYNQKELESGLKTKYMGRPLLFFHETDTTSNRIREFALEGGAEGALAVAESQTAGRGRRGRHWEAPAGTGVWMSLLLRPKMEPASAPALTLLAGLAVAEALEEVTGLSMEIKWPNDILCNGKKIVGILMEMDCEMQEVPFIVLGIGVNVNMAEFPEGLREKATSLYLEGGRTYSRRQTVHSILERFEELYDAFLQSGSFVPFQKRYREKCVNIGREVLVLGREDFSAVVLDVTPEGELLVLRLDTGREEVVFSGEVSIRKEGTG